MFNYQKYAKLIFGTQIFTSIFFHFFDIGTDINVLIDLKERNSEYFNISLAILIISTISSVGPSVISLRTYNNKKNSCYDCLFYFAFIIAGILQFTIFYDIYTMFRVKEKTRLFSNVRSIELLLESAPEALLQMFIVLKDNSLNNISSLSKYYLSIGASIINLITGIVSYEMFLHNYFVFCNVGIEYDQEGNIIEEAKEGDEIEDIYNILENKLKYNTKFVLNLFCYRTLEIISRIGLLSCFGVLYDGYYIIYSLSSEFVLGNIAVFYRFLYYSFIIHDLKYFRNQDEVYITDLYDEEGYAMAEQKKYDEQNADKTEVEDKDDKDKPEMGSGKEGDKNDCSVIHYGDINYRTCSIILFHNFVNRIKNIPVYADTFVKDILESEYKDELNDIPEGMEEACKKLDYWCNSDAWHFISKYTNGVTISTMIIYKLSTETYSEYVLVISIVSMCCLILNIPFIYKLKTWSNNAKKYDDMFKPIDVLFCNSSCHCDYIYSAPPEQKEEEDETDIYVNGAD